MNIKITIAMMTLTIMKTMTMTALTIVTMNFLLELILKNIFKTKYALVTTMKKEIR